MCPRDFSRSIESAISRLRRFSIRMAVCSSLKRVGFWPRAKRYQAMGTGQVPPKSTGHRTATYRTWHLVTFGGQFVSFALRPRSAHIYQKYANESRLRYLIRYLISGLLSTLVLCALHCISGSKRAQSDHEGKTAHIFVSSRQTNPKRKVVYVMNMIVTIGVRAARKNPSAPTLHRTVRAPCWTWRRQRGPYSLSQGAAKYCPRTGSPQCTGTSTAAAPTSARQRSHAHRET